MSDIYNGIAVLIPTRNRADLAINAIQSVLAQSDSSIRVLVSDNSDTPDQLERLARFCADLGDSRLRYISTPEPFSMTEHWEWASQHLIELFDANHFILLTDRMMFKPGEMKMLEAVASAYPDFLVSYNHDAIDDYKRPIRTVQHSWTGQLVIIQASRVLEASSRMVFAGMLPRALNCIIPRAVLKKVRDVFGNVFDSIAPDHNFCFRYLALHNNFLYYDKSPIFHYALTRSNGKSQSTGVVNKDNADFNSNLRNNRINYATPVPDFQTVLNASLNEYCVVKQQTSSQKFPDIETEKYLSCIAWEVRQIENPTLKRQMEALLATCGWEKSKDTWATTPPQDVVVLRLLAWARSLASRLLRGNVAKLLWCFGAHHFGIHPPQVNGFTFQTTNEAINYLNRYPIRKSKNFNHLQYVTMGWGETADFVGEDVCCVTVQPVSSTSGAAGVTAVPHF